MTTHPIDKLVATVDARRQASPDSSYTAKLLAGGAAICAKKLGEEAVEAVIAAAVGDKKLLASESADLLYHLIVVWAACGVRPEEVYAILEAREGRSGLDEKAARPQR